MIILWEDGVEAVDSFAAGARREARGTTQKALKVSYLPFGLILESDNILEIS